MISVSRFFLKFVDNATNNDGPACSVISALLIIAMLHILRKQNLSVFEYVVVANLSCLLIGASYYKRDLCHRDSFDNLSC